MNRFAAGNPDKNQGEIVRALRQTGASVVILSAVGAGCPDLLVGRLGRSYLLEVKTTTGKVRTTQQAFIDRWRGGPTIIVRSAEEALLAVGAMRSRSVAR